MTRPLPRRWTYPTLGILLAALAPAGFLVLRGALAWRRPTIPWLTDELSSQATAYLYVVCATALAFAVLGWILGRKEDLLEKCSTTDALTGLANRRHLHAHVMAELSRSARYGTPSALLLIDLDDLKALNDCHGHAAGDRALVAVAEAIRRSCRETDLSARYGGDEFVVLAGSTTASEALVLGERVRARLRETAPGLYAPVTVSIGVADLARAGSPRVESLYAAADQALYEAKSSGRDRVVLAALPRFPGGTVNTGSEERDGNHQARHRAG